MLKGWGVFWPIRTLWVRPGRSVFAKGIFLFANAFAAYAEGGNGK